MHIYVLCRTTKGAHVSKFLRVYSKFLRALFPYIFFSFSTFSGTPLVRTAIYRREDRVIEINLTEKAFPHALHESQMKALPAANSEVTRRRLSSAPVFFLPFLSPFAKSLTAI